MASVMQEKFQYEVPDPRTDNGNEWMTDKSAREAKARSGDLNDLPPGSNIDAQRNRKIHPMPHSIAGETDVSNNVNTQTMRKGYSRLEMSPTEDQYTKEHVDAFYGDIMIDGVTGFSERNNTLDRL